MLVDVVELRWRGEKLASEVVKAATPVRGLLTITSSRPGWYQGQKNPPLLAMVVPVGGVEHLLPPLDYARVTQVARGAMLVTGWQQWGRSAKEFVNIRQAWWVRPVVTGEALAQ